jgi:hypothetical protein
MTRTHGFELFKIPAARIDIGRLETFCELCQTSQALYNFTRGQKLTFGLEVAAGPVGALLLLYWRLLSFRSDRVASSTKKHAGKPVADGRADCDRACRCSHLRQHAWLLGLCLGNACGGRGGTGGRIARRNCRGMGTPRLWWRRTGC